MEDSSGSRSKKGITILIIAISIIGTLLAVEFFTQFEGSSTPRNGQNGLFGSSQPYSVQVTKVYYAPGCGGNNGTNCFLLEIDASYTGSGFWYVNTSDFEIATNLSRVFPAYPAPPSSNVSFISVKLTTGLHDVGDIYLVLPQGQEPSTVEYVDATAHITVSSSAVPPATQWTLLPNSNSGIDGNVKTVTLVSATLYGGVTASTSQAATSSLTLSLNNPGTATTITSLTLTGTGISAITSWDASSGNGSNTINFGAAYVAGGVNALSSNSVTPFAFYPYSASSQSITTGQTFNYVITFANGQSVSGSLIAQ